MQGRSLLRPDWPDGMQCYKKALKNSNTGCP
jgi:hypothetical protein